MEIIITEDSFTCGRQIKPSSSKNNTSQGAFTRNHTWVARVTVHRAQSGTVEPMTSQSSITERTYLHLTRTASALQVLLFVHSMD